MRRLVPPFLLPRRVPRGFTPSILVLTARHVRFGRLQEGFSEDPFLTSKLGVAAVNGLQGDAGSGPGTSLPAGRVAALAKHFLAYGPSKASCLCGAHS